MGEVQTNAMHFQLKTEASISFNKEKEKPLHHISIFILVIKVKLN